MTCRDLVGQCRSQLHDLSARADAVRARLDESAWNRAPEGGWSPAQIFEHMRLANAPYLELLPPAIAAAPAGDDTQARYTWFGRMIFKMSGPDGNAPAPKPLVPGPGPFGEEPFLQWRDQQEACLALLAQSAGKNIGRVRIRNPFLRMFRMTVCDCVAILATHTERHIRQIELRAS